MAKEIVNQPREAIFIDDVSKTVIFQDFTEDHIHASGAFWVPALGYNINGFEGHTYISGATNAGKSYFIKKMVQNDKHHRPCILFTDLSGPDKSLEGINYVKFDPQSKHNWDWVLLNHKNKILIFDDVQYNADVLKFKDTMLEKARHANSIVICVNHKTQDWRRTTVPLNECRYVVMFPRSNKGHVIKYLLYELGMNKNLILEIVDKAIKEGRQLILHKFSPFCIATSESILKL